MKNEPTPDAPGLRDLILRLASAKDKFPAGSDHRKAVWQAIELLRNRPIPSDWAAAVIAQVNKVEGAIDDASRQYHDSTRWAEEPSVYDDRSSPSLQDVIDQGFNDLRAMLAAAPSAPAEGSRTVEDDVRAYGTGYTLDGQRIDPSRITVVTAPEPLAQGAPVAEVYEDSTGCRFPRWAPTVRQLPPPGTKLYASPQPAALWCLHILGPDDVHPAPSKAHAEQAAERLNAFMASRKDRHPLDPECRAIAAPWPHSPESHAELVGKFIDEWLTPNPPQPSASVSERARELLAAECENSGFRDQAEDLLAGLILGGLPGVALRAIESALTTAAGGGELAAEVARLNAIINTPQADDFLRAVSTEAEHQRQRWGSDHDAGKTPADWFWLVGYLAGKALHALDDGNMQKAEHHIITTAAALANWHLAMNGGTNMRPGIDGEAALGRGGDE